MALENVNNALSKFENDENLFDKLDDAEKKNLAKVEKEDCKATMDALNESTVKTLGVTLDELMKTFEFNTNGKSYECFVSVNGEKKRIDTRTDLGALIQMYILAKGGNVGGTGIDGFIGRNTITGGKNVGLIKAEKGGKENSRESSIENRDIIDKDLGIDWKILEAFNSGPLTEAEKDRIRKNAIERRKEDLKEQKELKRVYELKDNVGAAVNGKWLSYRKIAEEFEIRDYFVYDERNATRGRWATPRERYDHIQEVGRHPKATEQEKKIAELYRKLLDAKHRLEEQHPDLKRDVRKYEEPKRGTRYMEYEKKRNPKYDL